MRAECRIRRRRRVEVNQRCIPQSGGIARGDRVGIGEAEIFFVLGASSTQGERQLIGRFPRKLRVQRIGFSLGLRVIIESAAVLRKRQRCRKRLRANDARLLHAVQCATEFVFEIIVTGHVANWAIATGENLQLLREGLCFGQLIINKYLRRRHVRIGRALQFEIGVTGDRLQRKRIEFICHIEPGTLVGELLVGLVIVVDPIGVAGGVDWNAEIDTCADRARTGTGSCAHRTGAVDDAIAIATAAIDNRQG